MADVGRPSVYSDELATEICTWIASGKSLRKFCEQPGKPSKSNILLWLLNPEHAQFQDQYARARELQAHGFEDECVDISDDGTNDTYVDDKGNTRVDWDVLGRSKLRIDTRKWAIERMSSKRPAQTENAPAVFEFEVSPEPERYHNREPKDGTSD